MKKILFILLLFFSTNFIYAQELSDNDYKRAEKLRPKCIPIHDSLEFTQYNFSEYIVGILKCTFEEKIYIYDNNDWQKIQIITDTTNIMPERKKLYIDGIAPDGNHLDIFVKQFTCNNFNYCIEKKYWYSIDITNKKTPKIADFVSEIKTNIF